MGVFFLYKEVVGLVVTIHKGTMALVVNQAIYTWFGWMRCSLKLKLGHEGILFWRISTIQK